MSLGLSMAVTTGFSQVGEDDPTVPAPKAAAAGDLGADEADPKPDSDRDRGPRPPRPDGSEGPRSPREPGKDDLSKEEHEHLRRLLQQVWDDPAIVQSRDEVRTASENFRRLLHNKMKALDPEAAKLMAKVSGRSRLPSGGLGDGKTFGGPGSGRPGRPDGGRAALDLMARPSFYASLADEQRKLYDAAYRKVLEGGALDRVMAELRDLRKKDEALRQKRTQQFGLARGLLRDAMIEADPRIGEFFPKHTAPQRHRRPTDENEPKGPPPAPPTPPAPPIPPKDKAGDQ